VAKVLAKERLLARVILEANLVEMKDEYEGVRWTILREPGGNVAQELSLQRGPWRGWRVAARRPRVDGKSLSGMHLALDFLTPTWLLF
jgi:hypothetical protein